MKEIKIGIVGSGFIADVHARSFLEVPGARVAAHCDVDTQRGRDFAARQRIERSFADYSSMLADGGVDAVVLGVPNCLHAEMALEAARAGKHVIVEKPLCLRLEEADQMIATCREAGVLLCYAEELCFCPKYVRAKEIADEGAIGKVYRVKQEEKHAGPYSQWFFEPEAAGGGILMDMGCHSIEFARWALGKPAVKAVTCFMDTVLHGERGPLEDDVVMLLEFDGGQTALLESSWALLGGMESVTSLLGTAGVIHADLLRGQGLKVFSAQGYGDYKPAAQGWTFPDYEWLFNNGYPQEDRHFVECMRDGSQPSESGEDGKAVLEIMLACYASAAEGRRIELPYVPPDDIGVPVEIWLRARGRAG
ncbi:MAG: Gfo/Idh/MocA family oxidoreductase [Deltaproteobacteria bacterium]|nr:Gfo/Idh/MocA family oxidoreductase [Deltaproteobacteria bacterium]